MMHWCSPYVLRFLCPQGTGSYGSAADLLQPPAFKQMRLSLGMLNSAGRILSGFNGATIVTLGDVALLVKAGPVTQQVLFSIVEDLGPYNAIMG